MHNDENTIASDSDIKAPSSKVVNEAHNLVCLVEEQGKSRGEYMKLTLREKAAIELYVCDHGVASAFREFKKKNLKESSIRDLQNAYLQDYKENFEKPNPVVTALSSKKRGRRVLLGPKFDEHLQHLLVGIRVRGTPVGIAVVMGVAEGILNPNSRVTKKLFPKFSGNTFDLLLAFLLVKPMQRRTLRDHFF